MEQALHHCHVQPASELAADLAFDTDQREPTSGVQGARCRSGCLDASHDRMKAGIGGDIEDVIEQQRADTPPVGGALHVHGVLHARAIPSALLVRRQRGEPHDTTQAVVDCHDRGERARAVGEPELLVRQAPRDEVEGGCGVLDFVVVDLPDGLGVVLVRRA